MNANDQFFARDAHVDDAAIAPLPNSRKIHVTGSRPDIRVPMREITQSDTPASFGAEKNPPLVVYDTSGPYTDPDAQHRHPRRACPRCAQRGSMSAATPRRCRSFRRPTVANAWPNPSSPACVSTCTASRAAPNPARNVSQMHYARRGIVTPEMEFVAIRENLKREEMLRTTARTRHAPASRPKFRRFDSEPSSRRNSCAAKSLAVARSSPTTSIIRKPSR